MRRTQIIAWSIAGLSIGMIAVGLILGLIAANRGLPLFPGEVAVIFSGMVYASLGGLVLSRQPGNPIAWILAGVGLVTAIEVLNLGYLAVASQGPATPEVVVWMLFWVHTPRFVIPLTLLVLLFPSGRLLSRRWRPFLWAAIAGLVLTAAWFAVSVEPNERAGVAIENPFGIDSQPVAAFGAIANGLVFIAMIGALGSVVVRFRRSRGIERLQMKWITYSMVVLFLSLGLAVAILAAFPDSALGVSLFTAFQILAVVSMPVAASIAILHYKLYDIDFIINRTLVYGGLTALVVGTYIVVVGALSALFQTTDSLLVSLIATGLIAVIFQPVRDRLQRAINRLLYGHRDEPYEVLSQLGSGLEGPSTPEEMLSSIVATIAQTMKLPYVAIALPADDGYEISSTHGELAAEQIALPLNYQGEQVGQLICAPRGPGESFTENEQQLLNDIANQAAVAVHALTLSVALQRSRERLVSAREEERRRLRRDLHDGLGPQLASLGLKLDAARNHLKNDPKLADAILLQLRWDVQDAIADIRRLVYNLRPPVLDELGLVPALRASAVAQLASNGPRVVVEGPDSMPVLPAAVEVAAYRIAQEAVTNVARHAKAQHCYVRLNLDNGLQLEVQDDGDGLPEPIEAGVGLNSMQERTSELGGQFEIEDLPEGGTRVFAQFPL